MSEDCILIPLGQIFVEGRLGWLDEPMIFFAQKGTWPQKRKGVGFQQAVFSRSFGCLFCFKVQVKNFAFRKKNRRDNNKWQAPTTETKFAYRISVMSFCEHLPGFSKSAIKLLHPLTLRFPTRHDYLQRGGM